MKGDASPTVFAYNKDKQPQKRKSSEKREQNREKCQLCEDAFYHHEEILKEDTECNTKETQTDFEAVLKVDVGIQCNIGQITTREQHDDYEEDISIIIPSDQDDEYDETNISTEEENDFEESNKLELSKSAFIVYWTSLLVLLNLSNFFKSVRYTIGFFKVCQVCQLSIILT